MSDRFTSAAGILNFNDWAARLTVPPLSTETALASEPEKPDVKPSPETDPDKTKPARKEPEPDPATDPFQKPGEQPSKPKRSPCQF